MTLRTSYGRTRTAVQSGRLIAGFHRARRVGFSVVVLGLSFSLAAAEPAKRTFNIDAKPATQSLTDYARQAHTQLGYDVDVVDDILTNRVVGEYDSAEALELLLEDTGLAAEHGERGIFIRRVPKREVGRDIEERTPPVAETNSLRFAQTSAAEAQATVDQNQTSRGTETNSGEDEKKRPFEEIIVTGTNIRGVTNPASPVLQFDKHDIELAGVATTQEFFETLPQNFSLVGIDQDIGGVGTSGQPNNSSAGSGADLRGLGPTATLTLLNGRRIAPSTTGQFVDLSLIPLSSIQRIEVLTDGASAVYGSDAIAGVVNLILRKNYNGADSRIRYGTVTDGNREEFNASQLVGKSWPTGSVLISYEYLKKGNLDASSRSFSGDLLADPTDLLPSEDRHGVLFSGTQALNSYVELFAEGLYANRHVDRRSVVSSGPRTQFIDNEGYNVAAGTRVSLASTWESEISASHSRNNLFTNQLRTTGPLETTDKKLGVSSIEAKADGTLLQLSGGPLQVAIGGVYRHETYFNFNDSEVFGDSSRNVYSGFAEALIPVVGSENAMPGIQQLQMSVAGRFEHYSDVGTAVKPKIGLLWAPVQKLILRGTYSRSFRAPLLDEMDSSFRGVFLFDTPDPSSMSGTTLSLYQQGKNPNLEPEQATNWTAGFNYRPETISGLDIRFTYFTIRYTDRLAEAASGLGLIGVLIDEDVFAPIITRSPDLALVQSIIDNSTSFLDLTGRNPGANEVGAIIDARLTNLSETRVSGIDFDISYVVDTRLGEFALGASGNYLLELENKLTPTAIAQDAVDTTFNPVDFRVRGKVSWSNAGWSVATFLNHTDGYSNRLVTPSAPVDHWTTVDLRAAYDTAGSSNEGLLSDIVLSVSIRNLFDSDPPFVEVPVLPSAAGFDPANASPLGRFVAFQIEKRW